MRVSRRYCSRATCVLYDVKLWSYTFTLFELCPARQAYSLPARRIVSAGLSPVQRRLLGRPRTTSKNTALSAVLAPYYQSLEMTRLHGNEEASSGGLGARRAREFTWIRAGKKPRHAAINPSKTIEIRADDVRSGLPARMRGAYGPMRMMPIACALKPPHRAVMTAFARLFGTAPAGCDGHAAS